MFRSQLHRRHGVIVCGLVSLVLLASSACGATASSTAAVGVRPGYEQVELQRVAVVPFYTTGQFSLDETTHQALVQAYQKETLRWLEERGIEAVSPEELEVGLKAVGAWKQFQEGVNLRLPLSEHFEPRPDESTVPLEVVTLKQLAEKGALPTQALLIGEVVYQTRTTCAVSADTETEQAEVVVRPGAPSTLPRPCVVSHFQAKLIDATTGETMWYSRKLREIHTAEITDEVARANIEGVVEATLGGPYGLGNLQEMAGR